MAKKGSLNQLIASMEKSERRHFTLFTNLQSGDKHYLNLFQAIARAYPDEPEYTDCADLAVTKNYLGKLILKSLKNFSEGKTRHSQLLHLLLEVEILFQKELLHLCLSKIKKGKALATKYESYTLFLEFIGWEKRVINTSSNPNKRKEIQPLVVAEAETLEVINNQHQYNALVEELMTSDFSDAKRMQQYLEHHLLANEKQAKSFGSLILFYHLKYILFTVTSKPDQAKLVLNELIVLMEAQPHRIKENPESYLTTLYNLMGMLLYHKETEEALEVLQKIRAIPETYGLKMRNYILRMFLKTFNVELELYRDLKDWKKADALMTDISLLIETHIIPNNYLLSFYYQFGYIQFQLGRYSEALVSINKILNQNFGDERTDLQTYARFLFLMIHFELGNITLLRYAVDNTRRFLKKRRGSLLPFEKEVLKFFSRLSLSPKHKYEGLLQKLSVQLFQQHDEEERSNILDYLDFESWITRHKRP